ncbi:MerR family transcriptional regulator [Ichthyobacterium seriolicida]|uniref:Transcriptional regulator n=1 Tax=Ichthyobacterium seriolicida TaxID=242600 RepID=A0A1J1DWJ9_9FLAO|nr:MerR family transcriptional regulator [Ichthyobacterium seriolicida]BAV94239.1 transcriptional regulator [Ichthyobacterium seriolicida]
MKGKLPKKLYYTISEVADYFNVNISLIRFWEKEFEEINPKRNQKGNRYFTSKDIDNIAFIYDLLKVKGYTIEGAKEKLKNEKEVSLSNYQLIKKLENIKSRLLKLKAVKDDL